MKKCSGFTLIELVIVLAILSIMYSAVFGNKKDRLKSRCQNNVVVVQVGADTYTLRNENGNIVPCGSDNRQSNERREVEQQNL